MVDDFDEGDSMSLCVDDGDGLREMRPFDMEGSDRGRPDGGEKLVDTDFNKLLHKFEDDFDESDVKGVSAAPGGGQAGPRN